MLLLCVLEKCEMPADLLEDGDEKAWTEDEDDVQEGDSIEQGVVVHVGQCREW